MHSNLSENKSSTAMAKENILTLGLLAHEMHWSGAAHQVCPGSAVNPGASVSLPSGIPPSCKQTSYSPVTLLTDLGCYGLPFPTQV